MPTKKKAAPADWPALLKSGPEGIARWNERSPDARQMTRLGGVDFSESDLTGVNFQGQPTLQFQGSGACFARANLVQASFREANLRDADFSGAKMVKFGARDSDLSGAKLAGVDLTGARLAGVAFVGADLRGANLTGADVTGADFTDADLTDTVLAQLVFDQNTVWPVGFSVPDGARWTPGAPEPRFDGIGEGAVATNLDALLARLHKQIDANRMTRTLEMLRGGTNQLFAEIEPDGVRGVVRSQREPDLVYSCVIRSDGTYACATPALAACMGLRGEPCKHLLVLLIGLTRAAQLAPQTADRWVCAARGQKHKWNETVREQVSDTLLRYKGAEAGEIDWRPTETLPEDFYAM
jgi:hypothetical protein